MTNKVTAEEVKASIKGETFVLMPDGVTTICQLTLYNGWTVDGKSACADPANYNKALGEQYAREDAERKVWPFLGFRLKDRLHREGFTWIERLKAEAEDLRTRLGSLRVFLESDAVVEIDDENHALLEQQELVMTELLNLLDQRITLWEKKDA